MADTLLAGLSTFEVKTKDKPEVIIRGHRGGNGPPLLLLHGFPQTRVIWHKVAPALAKTFSLVIPDLRGYGSSSKPATSDSADHSLYGKGEMAADMAKVMESLGYTSYFVVGHDRGGRVTHQLCADYPQRVKKCILLDIAPTLAMLEATDQVIATAYWHWFFLIQPAPFPEDAMLSAPEVFSRKMLRGLPRGSGGNGIFTHAAYEEYRKVFRDKDTVHGMCEDYRAAAVLDIQAQKEALEKGQKIKVPVLVLWGNAGLVEKKFNAVREWERFFEEGMVDGRSRGLDSGHYIPEECPDELVEDIERFFGS